MSQYGVFPGPYFPVLLSKSLYSVRIQENKDQKKLRIWTLFTQCTRVEILTLNFSIKDGLKIVSKTKMKNCWSTIDQGLDFA